MKLQDTILTYKSQLYFYTQTMNYPKRKLKNNSIHNSNKKNKKLRNKLYQSLERLVHRKLQNTDERNKIEINGKISYTLRLEELTLKFPYCPKWSTDSVKFLSELQWYSSLKAKNNPQICMETNKQKKSE